MNIHDATEQAYKNGYNAGLKKANNWVSVKDKSPDKTGQYICYLDFGYAIVLFYSAKHKMWNAFDFEKPRRAKKRSIKEVTHWMPLPELPKEANK